MTGGEYRVFLAKLHTGPNEARRCIYVDCEYHGTSEDVSRQAAALTWISVGAAGVSMTGQEVEPLYFIVLANNHDLHSQVPTI